MENDIYRKKIPKDDYVRAIELVHISNITLKNKELIIKFLQETSASGTGYKRLVKLAWGLRRIAEHLDKDFTEVTREDIICWFGDLQTTVMASPHINSFGYNGTRKQIPRKLLAPATKKDYYLLTKRLFFWLKKRDIFEDIRFVVKDSKKLGNLISEDHLKQIVEKEPNMRNKAMLWLLHETGMRTGELLGIKIRDIQKVQFGIKIRIDGKTGERSVPVIKSIPLIYRWLEEHPQKDNPNAWLWMSRHNGYSGERINYVGFRKTINTAFSRVGLSHIRHNPHSFRHSRATLMSKNLNETQMYLYFGWVIGSKQVKTYVHASGRDLDDAVYKMYGFKKEEQVQENLPIICGICKKENMCGSSFCATCGHPLTVAIAMQSEEKYQNELTKTSELLDKILSDPTLRAKFMEYRVHDNG